MKLPDARSSRAMGVDVESLTPGDGMWTVDCCNKAFLLANLEFVVWHEWDWLSRELEPLA